MKSYAESIALSLVLLLPYLVQLAVSPYYIPGPDETYQVQAALQLFLGNGYVSTDHTLISDLSKIQLTWVTSWPIAYSYVLFLLQVLGFSALNAAKFFQILAVLTGIAGWAALLKEIAVSNWIRRVFLLLLWTQFLSWGVYSTNAFSWSLMPILCLFFVRADKGRTPIFWMGLVSAVMILFRFQNIILIPAGMVALFIQRRETLIQRGWRALTFGVVPLLCFSGVYISNKIKGGQGTFLGNTPIDPTWHFRWIVDFSNAFLFNASYRLDEILLGIMTRLGLASGFTLAKYVFSFLGLLTLLVWCLRKRELEATKKRSLELFFATYLFFLCLMLFGLAAMLNIENVPIGRYYHSGFPFFLLLCLLPLSRIQTSDSLTKLGISLICCLSFGTVLYYAVYRFRLATDFAARANVVSNVLNQAKTAESGVPVVAFADQMFPHFAAREDIKPMIGLGALLSGKFTITSPVLIFLTADEGNPKPQYPKTAEELKEVAKHFGMSVRTEGSQLFAWKLLTP